MVSSPARPRSACRWCGGLIAGRVARAGCAEQSRLDRFRGWPPRGAAP